MNDYYQLLGVSRSATDAEIRTAYRKLALKYHPDKNQSNDADQKFREISTAYVTLIDPEKRREYNLQSQKQNVYPHNFAYFCDANGAFTRFFRNENFFPGGASYRHTTFESSPFNIYGTNNAGSFVSNATLRDILIAKQTARLEKEADPSYRGTKNERAGESSYYNLRKRKPAPAPQEEDEESEESQSKKPTTQNTSSASSSGTSTGQAADGQSVKTMDNDLFLTLEEVMHGCTKSRTVTCKVIDPQTKKLVMMDKQMFIKVQPGWKSGTKITFPEEGDMNSECEKASDIVFTIRDQLHPIFQRDKEDLLFTAKITLKEALCGARVDVPTLHPPSKRCLYFKKIISPGSTHRLTGEGLPVSGQPSKRGDIVIAFDILFPDKINKDLMEVLNGVLPP